MSTFHRFNYPCQLQSFLVWSLMAWKTVLEKSELWINFMSQVKIKAMCGYSVVESFFQHCFGTNLFLWPLFLTATSSSAIPSFARTQPKRRWRPSQMNVAMKNTRSCATLINIKNTKRAYAVHTVTIRAQIDTFQCFLQVWTFVQSCLILLSLATGIFVAASQNNLTFLRCIGKEEVFRWQIDNQKLAIENIFCQKPPLKLLQAGQVWWGWVSRTFVGSLSPFPQHCHLLVCPRCAWPVWGHLQVSENTYNNNTRLVGTNTIQN